MRQVVRVVEVVDAVAIGPARSVAPFCAASLTVGQHPRQTPSTNTGSAYCVRINLGDHLRRVPDDGSGVTDVDSPAVRSRTVGIGSEDTERPCSFGPTVCR